MTKVAIWCRHQGDDIIGIGANIPWNIPSDSRRFRHITLGQTLVVGTTTYESLPNRTLPNRRFVILALDAGYEVSDVKNHQVITDIQKLADYPEDLYISGGASVYAAFFKDEKLRPDIVVDCVYHGEVKAGLTGKPVSVAASVTIMREKYHPLPQTYELDNVVTTVWLKKGDFVEQSVVKRILNYLETEGKQNAAIP